MPDMPATTKIMPSVQDILDKAAEVKP